MDSIVASDVPYLAAFVAVAVLFIWLMGWLGQRGVRNGVWQAALMAPLCLYFAYAAARNLVHHDWLSAAIPAVLSSIGALAIWSAWRRAR